MNQAKISTWTSEPFITKKDFDKITTKATKWQKLRLIFRPSHYSVDGKYTFRYKWLDGRCFVYRLKK